MEEETDCCRDNKSHPRHEEEKANNCLDNRAHSNYLAQVLLRILVTRVSKLLGRMTFRVMKRHLTVWIILGLGLTDGVSVCSG